MSCTDEDRYDFSIQQGDDETVTFRYLSDEVAVDLTGFLAVFECSLPALTHDMTITSPSLGEMTATFAGLDTTGLEQRRVSYQVVLWDGGLGGTKETLFHGSLTLNPDGIL